MGMNLGSSASADPEVMTEMNTTPLIDVMLVLLIMLILTIPVQLHSVNLNLPTSATPPSTAEPPPVVTVDIDFDGTLLWNGEALSGRPVLDARLSQIAAEPKSTQPELHIRPNKLVDYAAVAGVLASAQRHGLTKIGVVGNEQFVK